MLLKILFIPFVIINLIAMIITVYDKRCALKKAWRVPEKTLLIISAIGGSAAMLAVMLLIRHKTKHMKFMLGIPFIIILQCFAIYFAFLYGILKF